MYNILIYILFNICILFNVCIILIYIYNIYINNSKNTFNRFIQIIQMTIYHYINAKTTEMFNM